MKLKTTSAGTRADQSQTSVQDVDPVDSLRQSCSDLLNPLVHYSFEHSADLVRSIVVTARKLDFKDLLAAATCSLTKMEENAHVFSRNQFVVNMYERSRWLCNELQAALGGNCDRQALQDQRQELFCKPYDLAPLYYTQAREAGKRLAVGAFRRELRCLRSAISTYLQALDRSDPDEKFRMTRHFGGNVTGAFESMFHELQLAERQTSAKPSLHRFRGAIRDFWDDVRGGRDAEAFPRLDASMREFEVESRIAFAHDLGSKVTAEAQRQVLIHEDTGIDLRATVQSVREMMEEWVIDKSNPQPQYGFGRACTDEELVGYLTTYNGKLFRAVMDHQEVGYYLLFASAKDLPPDVSPIISEIERAGEFMDVAYGWLHLVGVTRAGRELAHQRNIDLYSILHEAAIDTFSTFMVEKAFAIVREGEFANLAKPSHIKRGWRETGVMSQLGEFQYQAIRLDLCPGGRWG